MAEGAWQPPQTLRVIQKMRKRQAILRVVLCPSTWLCVCVGLWDSPTNSRFSGRLRASKGSGEHRAEGAWQPPQTLGVIQKMRRPGYGGSRKKAVSAPSCLRTTGS